MRGDRYRTVVLGYFCVVFIRPCVVEACLYEFCLFMAIVVYRCTPEREIHRLFEYFFPTCRKLREGAAILVVNIAEAVGIKLYFSARFLKMYRAERDLFGMHRFGRKSELLKSHYFTVRHIAVSERGKRDPYITPAVAR